MARTKAMPARKSKRDPTIIISISLPKSLANDARKKSETTGIPLSFKVQQAFKAWLAEDNKK